MTELAERLGRLIALTGPLTVERFMAASLGDPEHGYYSRGDPLGAKGDFVTAPEISQMFGELIGLFCAATWEQMGRPEPVLLAEIGPGHGTLMADALRAIEGVPEFRAALRLHLIESSATLRARQAERLKEAKPTWHDTIAELPEAPLLVIANELFDALPIRQLVRTPDGWCERLVDLDPDSGALRFVVGTGSAPAGALIPPELGDAPSGSLFEVSPAGISLAHQLGRRIAASGGAALVIDYGREESALGETLQAVRRHRPRPVLEAPGDADLTAHVDYALLGRAAREAGARTYGPVAQRDFLLALGIEARGKRLMESADSRQRQEIASGLGRLTDPGEMGTLFKAFAIVHPDQPAPAGFESAAARGPEPARAPGGIGGRG